MEVPAAARPVPRTWAPTPGHDTAPLGATIIRRRAGTRRRGQGAGLGAGLAQVTRGFVGFEAVGVAASGHWQSEHVTADLPLPGAMDRGSERDGQAG
jgi:hypothetical protein